MLTHFNMSSNAMQFLQPGGTNHQIATTNYQDTYICLLPFFHTYGVTLLMNTGFQTGAKLVTLPQFEVQSYLKAIDDHKVNISRYLTALFLSTLTHSVLCIIT
jgi:acyl-CoA synthetase (AMP-forming)/AMP-acid ligase II